MAELDTYLELLGELYEATLDPVVWPLVLGRVRGMCDGADIDHLLAEQSTVAGATAQADEQTMAALARLLPHLSRAMRLASHFEALRLGQLMMKSVADRLLFGVYVLDVSGAVLYHNAAAGEMAAAGDGIRLEPDGLRLASAKAQRSFDTALAVATGRHDAVTAVQSGIITMLRPSGRRPYTLWISAIRATADSPAPHWAAAAVFVTDPERISQPPPEVVAYALGLTLREAQLALALAAGDSLIEAAGQLGITHATARSYLKLIFRKTRVSRQGELVRLVLSTTMALPEPAVSALG